MEMKRRTWRSSFKLTSVNCFGLFFPRERKLNCPNSLVRAVSEDAEPISNAALSPRQSLLRLFELEFGMAHSLTPNSVETCVGIYRTSQGFNVYSTLGSTA